MQKTVATRVLPFRRLALINQNQITRHVASHAARGEYFATCHPGLEEIVAFELSSPAIGADDIRIGKAGVSFSGNVDVIYKSNLWLRSAIRVLSLLTELDLNPNLPAGESIYEAFSEAATWTDLLKRDQTFSVDARIYGNSNFTNSQLLSTRARDAICDYVRDRTGTRPLPPERGRTPDLPLFVTAFQDQIRIYRDCSGESLHRRGYRQVMHAAPLNEAAAAGCLYLSGWNQKAQQAQQGGGGGGDLVLADPMCGSGTFLIEAALMATNTAPGLFRRWWPFLGWPDADLGAWKDALENAKDSARTGNAAAQKSDLVIYGNDWYSKALELSLRDIRASGMDKIIKLHHCNCKTWELPQKPSLVITNPPWGKRLMSAQRGAREGQERGGRERERDGRGGYADRRQGRDSYNGRGQNDRYNRDFAYDNNSRDIFSNEDGGGRDGGEFGAVDKEEQELAEAWSGLGTFLKRQAGGADAFILSGSTTATQSLRLKSDKRIPITIGGIDCRLLQYHIRGLDPTSPSLTSSS